MKRYKLREFKIKLEKTLNSRTDGVFLALKMYFIAKAVPFHVA